ncbi:MAG: hypothetical protein HZB51_13360 [Chloroflexi bacterium]|nr:hypothetical protein [Chloroflexota bacterium]
MTEQRYALLIRIGAVTVAIIFWIISVVFSADGFNFIMPHYRWMGYLLAMSVTVLELVFVEEGFEHSPTVAAVGFLAYIYGIITNVIGVWTAQGSPDPSMNPLILVFPVILGLLVEIAPEPLVLWGLMGTSARDVLGRIFAPNKEAY